MERTTEIIEAQKATAAAQKANRIAIYVGFLALIGSGITAYTNMQTELAVLKEQNQRQDIEISGNSEMQTEIVNLGQDITELKTMMRYLVETQKMLVGKRSQQSVAVPDFYKQYDIDDSSKSN